MQPDRSGASHQDGVRDHELILMALCYIALPPSALRSIGPTTCHPFECGPLSWPNLTTFLYGKLVSRRVGFVCSGRLTEYLAILGLVWAQIAWTFEFKVT